MSRQLSFREAINEGISQEMTRDEKVICYGLDVADHIGIFGSTKGLAEKFGPERCFSTPLSEDAMSGMALGMAISGLRPIHVHIRVDFFLLTMNQLFNMISSLRYMSGGHFKVPLVIRAIIGRGWGQGAQHSKSLQSVFAHAPGLKVAMPTTPQDAKGLLISAVRDDNPVVLLEHRWLYDVVDDVPEEATPVPLGEAHVVREGKDATVVATSWMNVEALMAAKLLAERGVELEVIDPRTITPLDAKTIVASVNKTGHCVVADFDWTFCGFSAEVASVVHHDCFGALKSPVTRIGFAPTPCPTTRCLENKFYPNAGDIVRAVEQKLGLDPMEITREQLYSWEDRFKGPF